MRIEIKPELLVEGTCIYIETSKQAEAVVNCINRRRKKLGNFKIKPYATVHKLSNTCISINHSFRELWEYSDKEFYELKGYTVTPFQQAIVAPNFKITQPKD